MTDEKPTYRPELWSAGILDALKTSGLMRRWAEEERRKDQLLRAEHPWRWRAKQARKWARRQRQRLAGVVPVRVRWVGFGRDTP